MQLIKTWVWMMVESGNPELQDKGRSNLIAAFGTLANANDYISAQLKK